MTNIFFQKPSGKMAIHEYFQRSFSDELSPGGCYSGLSDQLWTPLALSGADYIDYTDTMTWPEVADGADRTYAEADNGAKLHMGMSTDTDYLISLGWLPRLCPAGHVIMQKRGDFVGPLGPLQRQYTNYGLFDSCDDVTLTVVRFPQINYDRVIGKSLLSGYFQTLDFSIRTGDSGASFTAFPFLALQLIPNPVVDDPPASYGLTMTQTLQLSYWSDNGTRCYTEVTGVPILESTSEWATTETTLVLRLHGGSTQPRKATASVSNEWVSESVELVFNENPLCHCEQGCCVRLDMHTSSFYNFVPGEDTEITPDNILSMQIELA